MGDGMGDAWDMDGVRAGWGLVRSAGRGEVGRAGRSASLSSPTGPEKVARGRHRCDAWVMKWDEIIMGAAAIIWGPLLLLMRGELLGFAREGGRGLRDRRVINALVISAAVLLPAGGVALILWRGI